MRATEQGGAGAGNHLSATGTPCGSPTVAVPIDVLLVIEMLARRKPPPPANRRQLERARYVVMAAAEFVGESPPRRHTLYTRDANERGVGFVTQEPLPIGRDAVLHIAAVGGDAGPLALPCTLVRFEKVLPGWYEGAFQLKAAGPRLGASSAPDES